MRNEEVAFKKEAAERDRIAGKKEPKGEDAEAERFDAHVEALKASKKSIVDHHNEEREEAASKIEELAKRSGIDLARSVEEVRSAKKETPKGLIDDPEAAAMGGVDRASEGEEKKKTVESTGLVDDPETAAIGGADREEKSKAESPEAIVATETSEERGTMGRGEVLDPKTTERFERAETFLSPRTREIFNAMPDRGRQLFSRIYEGIYRIPGVSCVAGRMEIAYNQFFAGRHERMAVGMKGRMDGLDISINAINSAQRSLQERLRDMEISRMPGTEILKLQIRNMEAQKNELRNRRDGFQTRLEEAENEAKLYINQRDGIADRLIGRYEEALEPMERELESLSAYKDRLDVLLAVEEARYNSEMEKLTSIEKQIADMRNVLRESGMMRERQIARFPGIVALENVLRQGRENAQAMSQWGELMGRKRDIERRIAEVDRRANPYRDRKDEFIRVKATRIIDFEVGARESEVDSGEREDVGSHVRERANNSGETSEFMGEYEGEKERMAVSEQLLAWNNHLRKEYSKARVEEVAVDQRDFFAVTRLAGGDELRIDEFKNILERYYKFRKIPLEKVRSAETTFVSE